MSWRLGFGGVLISCDVRFMGKEVMEWVNNFFHPDSCKQQT